MNVPVQYTFSSTDAAEQYGFTGATNGSIKHPDGTPHHNIIPIKHHLGILNGTQVTFLTGPKST